MTILELDEIIQSIIDMDMYKIEEIAKQKFHIDTVYTEIEEVIKQIEQKTMHQIEENSELLEYFKKEASADGKYQGNVWELITYAQKKENVDYFLNNSNQYGEIAVLSEDIIKMLIATKDIKYIDTYILNNNVLVLPYEKIEFFKEINDIEYLKNCIKERKKYKLDIYSVVQIIMEKDELSVENFIKNRMYYEFDNNELTALVIATNDTKYLNEAIINRKKYNLSTYNLAELIRTVQVIKSLTTKELIEYYIKENQPTYNFSTSEIAKIVTLDSNPEFLKSCMKKEYFSEDDKMFMALKSQDEEIIQQFVDEHEEKNEEVKKIDLPENITIGVEIESEGKQSEFIRDLEKFYKDWIIKYDASIKKGVEIVSPILTPSRSEEIYQVCNRLHLCGQEITPSCGGHIHIGANYLTTADSFKALITIWEETEKLLYIISNKEGEIPRESIKRFAKTVSPKIMKAIKSGKINLEKEEELGEFISELQKVQKKDEIAGDEKYYGIQFNNVKKDENANKEKNTIEFRLSNGTIDPNIWIENINLYGSIIKVSEDIANIERKEEAQMTLQEKKKYGLYKKLHFTSSDKEKIELLISLLFDDEHQREIYRKRYFKNRFIVLQHKEINSYLDNTDER